ncbi:MAG: TIGR04283 family arsenosugar biosynthesis glycosyltransferase [Thermoplasmata archaeon]|nr:MAG: TIGR04283 family arsenosugar biosynthesis glycosyltransferase [Thermoplasmata archaeon]
MAMISIITPVLNEEENIVAFLDNLNTLKGEFELIFVDGGSTDGTLKEIKKNKSRLKQKVKILSSPKGRAVQMNSGAAKAKGDILLFLHVDTQIESGSLLAIEDMLKDKKVVGGGFTHRFSGEDKILKMVCILGNMRVRFSQIFYGDYGIFIRRDIFEKMGGYDEVPILEDVELCKKAKKYGKLRQIEAKLITSPRRFESFGTFKIFAFFLIALALNIFGKRPEFLIKYIAEK